MFYDNNGIEQDKTVSDHYGFSINPGNDNQKIHFKGLMNKFDIKNTYKELCKLNYDNL